MADIEWRPMKKIFGGFFTVKNLQVFSKNLIKFRKRNLASIFSWTSHCNSAIATIIEPIKIKDYM